MKIYLVVNNPKDWPLHIPNIEIVAAKDYLTDSAFSSMRYIKVFNLCRSYRYQSTGYYVSLLAEARGHKPMPSVQTIQDLKSPSITRFVSGELDDLIQHSLKHIHGEKFVLSIYFGHNMAKCHDRLCCYLFKEFQSPFLQAQFTKNQQKHWMLSNISPILPSEIPTEHHPFVVSVAQEYFNGKRVSLRKKSTMRYDLAILHNPEEPSAPSNVKSMNRFVKAAEAIGFNTELITKEDYTRLAEFDALFIRETTNVNHHTYRFARRAFAEGLAVLDDPESILKCSNKVYLAEMLERHRILAPRTIILHHDNMEETSRELGFPCILKQPDSSFSKGVIKVDSYEQLQSVLPELLDKSDLLIAQQFLPTPFDWRVTILDRQPLFVCKYYMAGRHWQIYDSLNSGKVISGKWETFAVGQAPKKLISTALKAANLIGDGFYGVDIKEIDGDFYVIEINDNPSIDAGVEDLVLKGELYHKIMNSMLHRVEANKQGHAHL
jgi:glutathione synthase/RimK-type ligase-like ATP-grasp enzyme